jgi:hypothetical protein
MEETIEEFLEQEKLSPNISITVYSITGKECKGKKLEIKLSDFLDKYNRFLKKKSYLK